MAKCDKRDAALEHAWKYFQIHAQQRLSMFNFFVALSTIALAAIGAAIQAGSSFAYFGAIVGLAVPFISFVFWQLDRRTAYLVKHGEQIAIELEKELFEEKFQVFELESKDFETKRIGSKLGWERLRSYRESFQAMYLIVALIGLVGTGFSVLTALKPTEQAAEAHNQNEIASDGAEIVEENSEQNAQVSSDCKETDSRSE